MPRHLSRSFPRTPTRLLALLVTSLLVLIYGLFISNHVRSSVAIATSATPLVPELFFDGSSDPRFFNATFGEPRIDSQGRLLLASSHFSTICTGPCGVRLNSIDSNGVLNWQTPSDNSYVTNELLLAGVPITIGTDDRVYLQGRTTIYAFDSAGTAVSGWPVDVIPPNSPGPSRFPIYSGNSGLIVDVDGTVFAKSGVFFSFNGFPSTIVALRPDGTLKWQKDYDEGGLDWGLVQGPGGNIFTIFGGQRLVGIDRLLGTEYCRYPADGSFDPLIANNNSFVGGAGGIFTSFQSSVRAFEDNCNSGVIFTSSSPEVFLYKFSNDKVFGYTYPSGSLDLSQLRITGISNTGSFLWRNETILPERNPIHAERNGILYVLGEDTTDGNKAKLFLLDELTGTIVNSMETSSTCVACGVAVADDGAIFVNDIGSTRIYKVINSNPTPMPTPTPNQVPIAGFTMSLGSNSASDGQTLNITAPTGPVFVNFSADRSSDPDGSLVAWEWNIDGVNASNANSFTYGLNIATHNVSLKVTDNAGATSQQATGQISITPSSPPPPARRPVILIHGTGGSRLGIGSPSPLRQGWPGDVLKGSLGNPENLEFTEGGQPRTDTISSQLAPVDILDVPRQDDLNDLREFFESNGYIQDVDLYEFLYDFRYPVTRNSVALKVFVREVLNRTGESTIDLVAHSMGGLVAQQYLSDIEGSSNVGTLVTLGAPFLGTPKALKVLRYGDDLGAPLFFDACKVKRAAHNLPGFFNLLPGQRYFQVNGGGYFIDEADIDGDGFKGKLDFDLMVFNLKQGSDNIICPLQPRRDSAPFNTLSDSLVDEQLVGFQTMRDFWAQPTSVNFYAITGYNLSTVVLIREVNDKKEKRYNPTCTNEGDGTVPLRSAETVNADGIYYADLAALRTTHSQMMGNPQIQRQVFGLLNSGAGFYGSNIKTARPASFKVVQCQ